MSCRIDRAATPKCRRFIVRRAGHRDSADDIRRWMNERVGKTQRLADLRFIDELPRSAIMHLSSPGR